jgi:hypothetical protein
MILIHWTAFSQTDTGKICIPKETARRIAKDLLDGDQCRQVLEITETNLNLCTQKVDAKDGIIAYKDSVISAMDTISASQFTMYTTLQSEYTLLQKKYKKQKRKGVFKTIGNVTLIAGLITLFVVK